MRTPLRQPARRFRYSPLIAAFACAFSQASVAAPDLLTVNVDGSGAEDGTLRWALSRIIINECLNPEGSRVVVSGGPFVVSVSSPLPTISCPNVEIVGNNNITIEPLAAFYGGMCGLQASPTSGLTKISGVKVQNFSYGGSGAGMCGKLDASGNIVTGNGIGFSLTGGANIFGNTISSNTVKGVYDPVGGSTISGNTINGNAGPGILGAGSMVVTGNLVHNNSQHGIDVGASALVTGNTVHSNLWDGIRAGDTAVVKGNTTYGHTSGSGIDIATGTVGGPLTADRNVTYGNSTGIHIGNSGTAENNYIGVLADGNTAAGNGEGIFASSVTTLTIKNNVISGNTLNGIEAYDIGTLSIQGNKIGTNASGTAALGNGYGIEIAFSYGGQIDGNLVAGNLYGGIALDGVNLTVSNNQVGGAGALQNGGDGLYIDGATGGSVTGNILSGNSGHGLGFWGADNLVISGNKIGTDASGTVGIANGVTGIDARYSNGLSITGNQISANGFYGGVVLDSIGGLTMQGNLIGTASDGVSALSNNGPGVTISGFSNALAFSSTDLEPKIAKVLSGNMLVDNVIAHNNGDGVRLLNGTSNNTITGAVSGQSIHSNNGKNINLDWVGPRPNDSPDGSNSGPNGGQNHPIIASVVEDSGSTVIQGSLQSYAPGSVFVNDLPFSGQFTIDFYGNDVAGVPAGKTWLGKVSTVTNASGIAMFSATVPGTGFGHITATATGPFGTSEFSGTLQALTPAASITPMSVPFGNVPVGTTATTPVEVAFRSNGTGDYVIDSISQGPTAPTCPATSTPICATGDFSCSVSCTVGTPYPPLAPTASPSCKISGMSFHPTTIGTKSTTLWVCDNAGPTPRAITLSGTAIPNVVVSLSPWDVAFGPVPVGTTSASRTIAVSNNGENGAPLSGFAVTGPYAIVANNCGANLPPMSFCEAQVAFAPVAAGLAEGTFSVQIGLEGAPPYVARLSGTGTQQASLVLPGAIDFGAILRGSAPSVSQSVELRNTGNATLTFSVGISGAFGLSGDCGASLAPGAACTLTITFVPSTVGTFAGALDISSNAPGGSGSIPLSARVQAQPRADLRVDVSEMGFGDRMIGTRSGQQRVTVSNVGLVAAQLGVLPPTRDFLATSQCGATLAPGASCTADVVFMPMATGLRYNRLQFTSDAPGSPFGVDLSGRGCSPPRPGRPPSCD